VSVLAQVGNLSEGGLFLRTQVAIPAGTPTVVRFHLGENGPEHEAEAVVVWRSQDLSAGPPGIGLRFTRLKGELAGGIRSLVEVVAGQETGQDS
jgi:uncharacterized protein (TIGR02266 family)